MPTLHVLVDSKEQSITAARQFYKELLKLHPQHEIQVKHIRHAGFARVFMDLLDKVKSDDQILISMDFIGKDELKAVTEGRKGISIPMKQEDKKWIKLISYGCFNHIKEWGNDFPGVLFEENIYKRRDLEKATKDKISKWVNDKDNKPLEISKSEEKALERIWVQYRLMREIISNSELLDDVAEELIKKKPMPNKSIEDEFKRAFRYFMLREPDMAGGNYAKEKEKQNAIDRLRERINRIAATDFHVLIQGESGSGKETVAWAIHELSNRRDKPFLTLNCASFSDELLESELFGYKQGSHNMARKDHPGMLQDADGGTIFLDEFPDMGSRVQAKVLRLLESGEYRPVGSEAESKHVDVRIIAAGQKSRLNVKDRLRPDLKARVAQLTIDLIPLRNLGDDVFLKIFYALLNRYTWTTTFQKSGRHELTPHDIRKFQDKLRNDPSKQKQLISAEWEESNVRQLNNFIRQWIVFGDDEFNRLSNENKTVDWNQPQTIGISNSPTAMGHKKFSPYLTQITSEDDLKKLFKNNPFKKIEEAYAQYIWDRYVKIVEQKNSSEKISADGTQKKLAEFLGISKYALCRRLKEEEKKEETS